MREVVAHARQGLAIGGPAEVGFDKATLPYVPGSTVRGAFAAGWIRQFGPPTVASGRRDEFVSLFERDICYGPLFQRGTRVTPLSVVYCKYPTDDQCLAWSADQAVEGAVTHCRHCRQRVATGRGEVEGIRTRRVQRTELGPDGTPVEERLYARHELAAGLTYHGWVTGTHPWLDNLPDIWLGGRTGTTGRVTVSVAPTITTLPVPASPRPDGALVVRLTSPAVIVDDYGRPRLDPVPEILRILNLPPDAARTLACWVRPVRVGGWNARTGLPKPIETALAMGSVVVLALTHPPDQARLNNLATAGIGLRRVEGFGTVTVNPPAWQRTTTAPPPPPAPTSALAPLREVGLLDDVAVVRWLVDRARTVLAHRQQNTSLDLTALLAQRVPGYFDDKQADAVRAVFTATDLPSTVVLLQHRLETITLDGEGDLR